MRRSCRWSMPVAAALCFVSTYARAGQIDPGLQEILDGAPADQVFSVIAFLNEQVDLTAATRQMDVERATLQRRHEHVIVSLQGVADTTQGAVRAFLQQGVADGGVRSFEAVWIRNLFIVEATKATIIELAAHPDVDRVYFDYEIELIKPMPVVDAPNHGDEEVPQAPEIGLVAIRAPEVWAMGIDGSGVLVSNMDTGVDGNHPALRDRWAGVADSRYQGHPEWAYFDPFGGRHDFPRDQNGHGTHTMGTVTGGPPGDQIGVAPGAFWIAAAPIDRGGGIPRTVADAILSFQWLADPDGNPNTNWDVPATNSNSWGVTTGHGYPPCDQTFWSYIDACEAAGIFVTFSAGNEGSSGLRRPADRATTDYNCNAVAAIDANNPNWPIASFSSRGPTNCTPDGRQAIKPDIGAPGVDVRSSLPGGGYGRLSGTSMASPHINGVAALMRQANPNISVDDMKQVMYETAVDLGNPGEDNSYGWGMVDAFEAVSRVLNANDPYACCFGDGSCSDVLPQDCRAAGGKSRFGYECGQISCPQPGACCFDDGTCDDILEANCTAPGSDWSEGDCGSVDCPQPGACCFDDGTCQMLGPVACENAGGEFSGHGISCDDAGCPQPGACCVTDDECRILGPDACRAAGGSFKGHDTTCTNACPCDKIAKLKAKCNDSGNVKVVVKIVDDSMNGERITVDVRGTRVVTGVLGNKAKLIAGPFSGPVPVRVVDPDCTNTVTAQCP
ncbi:MAG: S8 family serine peptidase [Phycisphaerae bacterium]|nr:MAG: S8 family serine peptidase [Phycisphaerae bacterium]MBE7455770.1 S8 family serine peptidase [Planctomycetia bacterium]MCK6463405.1 S8 family serine peptidase [Phycisphaerae bacterium]MCL4717027.1 S8 family serine peptidase [Phycisphaerae bacterium]NUQ09243.1 S8 family serine peptidase [Phycisphaerae bacterium]